MNNRKRIIIFGATGYIGTYLIDYLINHLASEYEIIAVGRRNLSFFTEKRIQTITVDICKPEDFQRLPKDNIYAVINLTGVLPAYLKQYDPFIYVETNINGSLRIMEYAREVGADRVLYAQTWAVQAGYWGKEDILSPSNEKKLIYTGDHAFYSITKCMVEESMEYYKQEYGIKNFIFRLPNVYMYAPQKTYFVDGVEKKIAYRYMIDQATQGHDLELWGNPDAFKDILYIKDLCLMMFLGLFAQVNGGTYNAGTGIRTTLRQQIQGIIDVFSPNPKGTKIIEVPMKDSFTSFVMDINNAKEELGYEPKYTYIDYLMDYKKEQNLKRFDSLFVRKSI